MKPRKANPQLVCHHGTASQPNSRHESIVVGDSFQARNPEYWKDRVPDGASFRVDLWPAGWGYGAYHFVLQHQSSELAEPPPVAGSEPTKIALLLPHGASRTAMLMPVKVKGAPAYQMRVRPGDSEDAEQWEAMIPSTTIKRLPSSPVVREILKKQKKKAVSE